MTSRCLSAQQEGLRKLPFAADLERSEVFVPETVRGFRHRLSPHLQLVEIIRRDLAIPKPVEQVVTESGGKVSPSDLRHEPPLIAEGHSGQLFLELPLFGGVGRFRQAVRHFEKVPLLVLSGIQASLDELDDHAVGARALLLRDRANPAGDRLGKSHCLAK